MNNFKKIFEVHKKQLKNISVPHKKLAICFAGIPGSGKTHLVKLIEEKYFGVRINSDELRKIILNISSDKDDAERQEILQQYLKWFLTNCNSKNGLLILDSGIERKYKWVFPLLKQKKYRIFVISFDISRDYAEKNVIKKLGKLDKNFIENIDRWIKEYKEFSKYHKSDVVLKEGDKFDALFSKFDTLIK